jgi:hypothetical protein
MGFQPRLDSALFDGGETLQLGACHGRFSMLILRCVLFSFLSSRYPFKYSNSVVFYESSFACEQCLMLEGST